jgi:hypothetical protein
MANVKLLETEYIDPESWKIDRRGGWAEGQRIL